MCDNSSLVNKVNKIADSQWKQFPNETLEPDWDATNEIVSLIKNSKQTIKCIRGHHDEKMPKARLPLPAQLNFEENWNHFSAGWIGHRTILFKYMSIKSP